MSRLLCEMAVLFIGWRMSANADQIVSTINFFGTLIVAVIGVVAAAWTAIQTASYRHRVQIDKERKELDRQNAADMPDLIGTSVANKMLDLFSPIFKDQEARNQSLTSRVGDLEVRLLGKDQEVRQLKSDIGELIAKNDALKAAIDARDKLIDDLRDKQVTLASDLASRETQLQSANAQLREAQRTIGELKTQLNSATAQIDTLTARVDDLAKQVSDMSAEKLQLVAELDRKTGELTAAQATIADQRAALAAKDAQIAALASQVELLNSELAILRPKPPEVNQPEK